MVLSAEGEWYVVIDVVRDACLGGAPGCFGVQRGYAPLFSLGED